MKQNRISYLATVFIVILLGLLSRKTDFLPLYVGDLLYAVMIYFGILFLNPETKSINSAILALMICYCIELLQLSDAEWMTPIRNSLFGRYVLGQGFLWSDIIAYTFGIIIAFYFDKIIMKESALRN
ncbi:MAG: DUF2809 domain-containing protein [Flavobacterium sp.]|nr:MAG: DUF2809 domain-containing protein [Flavobacterium sp.]